MVLNLRGTGGSGKSTIARSVMARYASCEPVYVPGRRRPAALRCVRAGGPALYVPGHYDTPCGGGDTLPSPSVVFGGVVAAVVSGDDALFEGIISQDDVTRTVALNTVTPVYVVGLDVPVETCLASIADRRQARGDTRPLSAENTVERAKRLPRIFRRLTEAGVSTIWLDRDAALRYCVERLGLDAPVPQRAVMQGSLF